MSVTTDKHPRADTDERRPAGPARQRPDAESGSGEHGGRDGPEPTRYGDWEKNGRCIDF